MFFHAYMHSHMCRYSLGIILILLLALMTVSIYLSDQRQSASNRPTFYEMSNSPLLDFSFSAHSSLDKTLSYRRLLELTTSPRNFNRHHATLGFSHIYCISLPHRTDRRETMNKIAAALGIRLTFVDAVPKEHSVVGWIGEQASIVRRKKLKLMSEYSGLDKEEIGGMGSSSVWLTMNNGQAVNKGYLRNINFPSLSSNTFGFGGKNWVDYLWSVSDHSTLSSSKPNFNVTAEMWDNQEERKPRQMNAAAISTYYNHMRVLRMIRDSGDKNALILEDDVDMEWDLERRWRSIENHLPTNWETVFLGHCWGLELLEPQFGHPHLHKSTKPLCFHGYAVSKSGSEKLLELYNDPWIAFQTPVDAYIPTFIKLGLNSFSVEPSIINQSKILSSDIQSGTGSMWRGLLVDSVAKRILKSEGIIIDEKPDRAVGDIIDPSTVFRYGSSFKRPRRGYPRKQGA